MKCPRCDIALNITDRQNIEIDFCPQCRGVWLDRGELDKIVERASRFTDQDDDRWQSSNSYRGDDRPRGHDGSYRKRKSFWSELFD